MPNRSAIVQGDSPRAMAAATARLRDSGRGAGGTRLGGAVAALGVASARSTAVTLQSP
jgi:hypothetical protein